MADAVGGCIENWCKSLTHVTWDTARFEIPPACNDANKSGEEQIMRALTPLRYWTIKLYQTISNYIKLLKYRTISNYIELYQTISNYIKLLNYQM